MTENDSNPLFDTDSVSYGAAPLQQLLLLQAKDLMLRRWLQLLDQQEQSGGKLRAMRSFAAATRVLYEELRPRIKTKVTEAELKELDEQVASEPEKLMRYVLEYLELDLKLTKVDMKKEYDRTNIYKSNKIKGLI